MEVHRIERSLGELFSDLSQQTADLVRQEVRLAKVELSDKLSHVARHAMMIGAAVALGLGAVVAVAAAITLLLIEVGVTPWLSAAITAIIMGGAAFVIAQSAIASLRRQSIAPEQTLRSLKETTQWLKNPSTR